MRSLSEAQPSLGGAGWGVARREPRALARAPTSRPDRAVDSAHALRAFGATPHPASARLTPFAKPSHPSPARGEGEYCLTRLAHLRLPCPTRGKGPKR